MSNCCKVKQRCDGQSIQSSNGVRQGDPLACLLSKHGADKVADGRSARKSDKYDGIADSNGMRFIPFVVSTYGGWHKSAKSVLRRLIAAMEPAYCLLSRADWQRQLTQQVAIAIQRGNAAIMIHAAHRDQCHQL